MDELAPPIRTITNGIKLTFSGWLHSYVSLRALITARCHDQTTSVATVWTDCHVKKTVHICKPSNMHACYFSMYKPQCHSPMMWLPNLQVGNHTNTVNRTLTNLTHLGRVTQILRFYITTVQDVWHKSAFLTRACFPCTIHLIIQYTEPVSEWSCWRMFIETWPHFELNPWNVHLNNLKARSSMC